MLTVVWTVEAGLVTLPQRSIESTASDSQLPQRPCLSNSTAERQSIHHQRFMIFRLLKQNLIFLSEYILDLPSAGDYRQKAPLCEVP